MKVSKLQMIGLGKGDNDSEGIENIFEEISQT